MLPNTGGRMSRPQDAFKPHEVPMANLIARARS